MSLVQVEQMPLMNYHEVNWEAFNKALDKALASITTIEEFQLFAHHLDDTLRSTAESCVPKSRPHPHHKRWWTKDLMCLSEELKYMCKLVYKFHTIPNHKYHGLLKKKEKQLDKEIQTTKESHWREWLEGMADNNIWITSKYLTNPGGDGGKSHMPTLKMKDAQGCMTLVTSNEEKSFVKLARTTNLAQRQTK